MFYLNEQAEFIPVDANCNEEDARWELSEEFSTTEHQVYVVVQAGQFGRNRLEVGSLCQNGVIMMLHTASDLERVEREHGRAALLRRLQMTWARLYPAHGGAPTSTTPLIAVSASQLTLAGRSTGLLSSVLLIVSVVGKTSRVTTCSSRTV